MARFKKHREEFDMCRTIQKLVCCALLVVTTFGGSVCAEDITYTGGGVGLRTVMGHNNSFAPSTEINSGNTVTVQYTLGTIPGFVVGGWGANGDIVSGNVVDIKAGRVGIVRGGSIDDNITAKGPLINTVINNTVNIYDGAYVTGNIYGGFAQYADDNRNVVNNNSVILWGGTIYGGSSSTNRLNIYGGYAGPVGPRNTTQNNSVTVYEAVQFDGTRFVSLKGNAATGPWINDGNTLNVYGKLFQNGGTYTGKFWTVDNFQYYNFFLTDSVAAGDVLLPVTTAVVLAKQTGLTATTGKTTIGILGVGTNSTLDIGDRVVLINNTTGDGTDGKPSNIDDEITAHKGLTQLYTFGLDITNINGSDALVATLRGIEDNVKTDTLPDSNTATMGLVRQGSDLVINQGMGAALDAASCGRAAFLAGNFGNLRYHSCSGYADLRSGSLIAGMAFGKPMGSNCLSYGLFYEMGHGEYDSNSHMIDDFSSIPDENIHGEGRTHYNGGGVLLRYQKQRGAYFDASFRTGQLYSDYSTHHIVNRPVNFDYSVWYCGSHLGLGHVFRRNRGDLDLSAKYLWTYHDGSSHDILDENIRFYGCHSHRVQAGGQFLFQKNRPIRPYLGAAYEYELAADLRSSVDGVEVEPSRLRGGTGIGELGLKMQFRRSLTVGLAGQGYVGQRSGASASCDLRLDF